MEIAHRNDRSQCLQNIYCILFPIKSERLSANIKLTLHTALIRSIMGIRGPYPSNEIAAPAK
jgi:hypothetical protein